MSEHSTATIDESGRPMFDEHGRWIARRDWALVAAPSSQNASSGCNLSPTTIFARRREQAEAAREDDAQPAVEGTSWSRSSNAGANSKVTGVAKVYQMRRAAADAAA